LPRDTGAYCNPLDTGAVAFLYENLRRGLNQSRVAI
jgi:hypothetical protein